MKDEDVNAMAVRGERTALLLGEVMGRLVMSLTTPREDDDRASLIEELDDLLELMKTRISSIYYENKK